MRSGFNPVRRVFSGISRFPRPFIPALLHIHHIGSIDVKSRPNLSTPLYQILNQAVKEPFLHELRTRRFANQCPITQGLPFVAQQIVERSKMPAIPRSDIGRCTRRNREDASRRRNRTLKRRDIVRRDQLVIEVGFTGVVNAEGTLSLLAGTLTFVSFDGVVVVVAADGPSTPPSSPPRANKTPLRRHSSGSWEFDWARVTSVQDKSFVCDKLAPCSCGRRAKPMRFIFLTDERALFTLPTRLWSSQWATYCVLADVRIKYSEKKDAENSEKQIPRKENAQNLAHSFLVHSADHLSFTSSMFSIVTTGTGRATWLDYSPPTNANRVRFSVEAAPGFSHVGIVPDDAAGRWVFSGISRFPRLCIPALLPHSPRFTLIGSQDLDVKSRPNLSTPLRGDPGEQNPPASGYRPARIPIYVKPGATRDGDRNRFFLVGGEQSNRPRDRCRDLDDDDSPAGVSFLRRHEIPRHLQEARPSRPGRPLRGPATSPSRVRQKHTHTHTHTRVLTQAVPEHRNCAECVCPQLTGLLSALHVVAQQCCSGRRAHAATLCPLSAGLILRRCPIGHEQELINTQLSNVRWPFIGPASSPRQRRGRPLITSNRRALHPLLAPRKQPISENALVAGIPVFARLPLSSLLRCRFTIFSWNHMLTVVADFTGRLAFSAPRRGTLDIQCAQARDA
ncbi:hypothetical protein PR048_007664 [Dryococelus australis]|uniref:Uncharacterized protein n=1 Tax=Dryococelus australis TaxID=614101 RepID=A0ABQ9HUV7_9NEOP|nr:hypothetical protein PR048_007664 [Dryococelus australis]